MNSHRIFYTVLASVLLIPMPLFAGEFDFILGDVDRFTQDIQWQIDAEVRAMEDHKFQQSDELFLPVDEEDEKTFTGLQPAVDFVTVKVDGIPVTFSDVPTDAWFGPYVRAAAESGIVSGYRDASGRLLGTFGPADVVTVEQLAKMALQASGVTIQDCAGVPKNSTATGSWSAHFIACAEELSWAVYSDASIDVRKPATRSQVIVTIIQAFDVAFKKATGDVFTDVSSSTEFSGAIERAAADGLVAGYADANGESTGEFGPTNSVNRAEVAKMISLALDMYGN